MEHNDDIRRDEDKALKEKTEKFNSVSDDTKMEAASNALGLDLVQIGEILGHQALSESSIKSQLL